MPENFLAELLTLAVIVFAAVEQIKKFGASGNALTISAFVFGLLLGVGYRYAISPMGDFASWFWAIVFGLMAGFMATGAYDGARSIVSK